MLEVKVWGDYACFTRPEHKVERVSYDVMTPSAARGVLEAIAWKPEFYWKVREIWILNPIRHFGLVRNEVRSTVSARTVKGWAKDGEGLYDAETDRTQRYSLILRDVAYLIRAEIVLKKHAATDKEPKGAVLNKYETIFNRRVSKGQAFSRPYLGTREFSAYFAPPDGHEQAIDHTDELGRMLFDMKYTPKSKGGVTYRQHGPDGGEWVEGKAEPVFFDARLEQGILYVPDYYEKVR
ncbi:MAG: type I-C CRISPR-associated protein Cas5c [Trueperaceae bacterium]|nr:type I-C CRISPR-associated protein Cas5c [Trueperaceae bacterium]